MKFFSKLERKYSKYAIRNLMYYIMILYGIGIILHMAAPGIYWRWLCLNPEAILKGQVWRLATFLLFPPVGSMASFGASAGSMLSDLLFNGIALSLYYSLGSTLERVWGAFRFNVYFFMGVIGHALASILVYLLFDQTLVMTTMYLNFSLFFAFAAVYPNLQFYLFMLIPVRAKVLAIFDGIFFLYGFIVGNAADRCAIVLSLANFLIFFMMTRNLNRVNPKEIKRKREFEKQVKIMPQGATRHKCAICGRTEKDGDDLEFRYCSKCAGGREYCQDHLYTHVHVTAEDQPVAAGMSVNPEVSEYREQSK